MQRSNYKLGTALSRAKGSFFFFFHKRHGCELVCIHPERVPFSDPSSQQGRLFPAHMRVPSTLAGHARRLSASGVRGERGKAGLEDALHQGQEGIWNLQETLTLGSAMSPLLNIDINGWQLPSGIPFQATPAVLGLYRTMSGKDDLAGARLVASNWHDFDETALTPAHLKSSHQELIHPKIKKRHSL